MICLMRLMIVNFINLNNRIYNQIQMINLRFKNITNYQKNRIYNKIKMIKMKIRLKILTNNKKKIVNKIIYETNSLIRILYNLIRILNSLKRIYKTLNRIMKSLKKNKRFNKLKIFNKILPFLHK